MGERPSGFSEIDCQFVWIKIYGTITMPLCENCNWWSMRSGFSNTRPNKVYKSTTKFCPIPKSSCLYGWWFLQFLLLEEGS